MSLFERFQRRRSSGRDHPVEAEEGSRLEPLFRLFRERTRRSWLTDGRAYVEIAEVSPYELADFDRALRASIEGDGRIRTIEVNAHVRRVSFSFESGACTLSELVELVAAAEHRAFGAAARFSGRPEHPSDVEPSLRRLVSVAGDAAAFFSGALLSVSPFPAVPFAGNAAAILSIVGSVGKLRSGLEERLGPERTELFLALGTAFFSALAQRPLTTFVDGIHKLALLREANASRAVWERLEPKFAESAVDGLVAPKKTDPRPVPLPRGPVEEYADRAWIVSLAGFAVSFATTGSFQRAVAALYGSMPSPARRGRDVFAAELAKILSGRDSLLLDPAALRRLDRLDCLVLEAGLASAKAFALDGVHVATGVDEHDVRAVLGDLFEPNHPLEPRGHGEWRLAPARIATGAVPTELEERARTLSKAGELVLALERAEQVVAIVVVGITARTGLEELITAAHDAGLRVVVASSDDAILQSVHADDVITGGENVVSGIRRLQREGRGVCLVALGDSPGLPVADFGIGLCRAGMPVPWGAHLLCPDDLAEVGLLLQAAVRAREISKQSVNIALGAAALGALVSAGGFLPRSAQRVVFVVNAATMVSMANGVRGSVAIRRLVLPPSRDPTPWHALDADGVLRRLKSNRQGLSRRDAEARKAPLRPWPSAVREFGEAITDELFSPLAPLLAAGAGLSAAVGSVADAAMVGSVMGFNAVVGGAQKVWTERKLRLLARTERRRAIVRRDEKISSLDAASLVPGDVVLLESGDVVPADCRILEAVALEIDASSLTGESLPVKKFATPSFETQTADHTSMLYQGTSLVSGRATAVVVAVGEQTEALRGAAGSRSARSSAGVERRLRTLMGLTGPVALAAGVGVVGGGLLRGRKLEELVGSAVSLAVASVPEGLPLLATAAQLAASERLSRRRTLVRNARSLEALGRVDVVCLDKTGTITEGSLALAFVSDGDTHAPADALSVAHRHVVAAALRATSREDSRGSRSDPTDFALRAAAKSAGVDVTYQAASWERLGELSLSIGRTYHAVLGRSSDGTRLAVKGAHEVLLLHCKDRGSAENVELLDDAGRLALVSMATALAARGLRVLAVADRAMASDATLDPEHVVDLTFRGFIAFRDPVRPSARAAVDGLRRAGVRTVMITGDHPSTAEAVAAELDLLGDRAVVTGAELARLGDDELDRRIERIAVFARVTPSQKVRVVRALQRAGRVVAMAGDGANDAAAIRLSDAGIAVGEACTQAARAAADIVVLDGRVETIVDAIVEGRAMWASVRDAVSILVGGNLGEIGFTLLAGLIDGRPPLVARQLLLVNFFTDVAPAMAIALKPPAPRTFESLARESPEAALGAPLNREIATRAIATALGAGSAWTIGRVIGSREKARSIGLCALVGTQLGQTLTAGGLSRPVVLTSVASAGALFLLVQTPGISHFFGCRPLGPVSWTAVIGASVAATRLAPKIETMLAARRRAAVEPELDFSVSALLESV